MGSKLRACAFSPDGLVEGIEVHDRTFIMGVQWHPEYLAKEKSMGCLFSTLVNEARTTADRRASLPTAEGGFGGHASMERRAWMDVAKGFGYGAESGVIPASSDDDCDGEGHMGDSAADTREAVVGGAASCAHPPIPSTLSIRRLDDDELWPSITFADCI